MHLFYWWIDVRQKANIFQFKYSLLDFERQSSIKPIMKEIDKLSYQEFLDQRSALSERLVNEYWLLIYQNQEDVDFVKSVIGKTIRSPDEYIGLDKFFVIVNEQCEHHNKLYLKDKILNTCPNGYNIVYHYLQMKEDEKEWKASLITPQKNL